VLCGTKAGTLRSLMRVPSMRGYSGTRYIRALQWPQCSLRLCTVMCVSRRV